MDKELFYDELTEKIKERLEEDCSVARNTVLKNNGVVYNGISISREGSRVSPNIYLDSYYESYQKGKKMDIIADEAVRLYKGALMPDIDSGVFMDFEKAKKGIVYRIVNYDKNREMLENSLYERFMDLAMVFYYSFAHEPWKDMNATVRINNAIFDSWKVKKEEVIKAAKINTPLLLPVSVRPIGSIIRQFLEKRGVSEIPDDTPDDIPMYVLTNETGVNGAAVMAYPGLLREFADRFENSFYIIPSSIHEIILVPEDRCFPGLNEFISRVNAECLNPEEVLSDHAYYYDREEEKLSCHEQFTEKDRGICP